MSVKSQRARVRDEEAVSQRGVDQKFLTAWDWTVLFILFSISFICHCDLAPASC